MIAEFSLYMLPSRIVHAYAVAQQKDFWDCWVSLGIDGYTDTDCNWDNENDENELDKKYISLYRAFRRENEDEFIEFWKDEDRLFSDQMLKQMEEWKSQFESACPDPDMQMEPYLASIIRDLKDEWNCRLTDQEFIQEFLENEESVAHRKALVVLRNIMDADLRYFPELTRRQAIDWMIRSNRNKFESVAVSAYQSLLVNVKKRKEILGF